MKRLLVLASLLPVFPLSPAFAGQVTIAAAQDTTLYSESGATGNGAGSFLFAGNNAMSHTRRALLRFDVAASVPAGSTITSVELALHVSQAQVGAATHTLHRISASWGEGASDAPGSEGSGTAAMANDATWTERFFGGALPWTTPGGDFAAVPSTSLAIDGVATWTFPSSAALVLDVQQMLDAPALDFGWIVRGNEGAASTAKRFDSRHNTDPNLQPRLVVDFTPPCAAPASYCTAAPNSAGAGAQIGWSGSPSLSTNLFTLTVASLPASTSGLFFYGPSPASVPFGAGFRCVTGSLRRLGLRTASGGSTQQTLDFTLPSASDFTAGSTAYFQFWYLDPAGSPGFNLSNGLSVAFCP